MAVSLIVPVSRKTPGDGKLEIPASAATHLEALGQEFDIVALGTKGRGRAEAFECTCSRAAGERHVHHFVVSPLLRGLTAGHEVRVEIDAAAGLVTVR